jgi:hypothetical protein
VGLIDLPDFDFLLYADGCLDTMLSTSITGAWGIVGNAVCSPQDIVARIEVLRR